MQAAIVTDQLTRRFGQKTAVDRLDLEISAAQIFGFLGPNGSGKSTTFRMLCGLLRPDEGDVRVFDRSIRDDTEQVRRMIGYMTQQFSLYRDLSVIENLNFIGKIQGLGRADRRRRIAETLTRYRLEELVARRPENLSGGERQRLALAAAALHHPPILLLDEPTSGVDPQTRRDFWDILFELVDQGVTVLVSTHYMDEAERCHRLAILNRGRLVAAGEPDALIGAVGYAVIEIEGAPIRAIRERVESLGIAASVAQLGSRLHVLIEPAHADPRRRIGEALHAAGIEAEVREARPSLEDVFVAATGAA